MTAEVRARQRVMAPPGDRRALLAAAAVGAVVGVLGGMIGLGGAELRLPVLMGFFAFAALQAVIANKALSLIVVLTALPVRLLAVPYAALEPHWTVALTLLAGSLLGAWAGATWAVRARAATLQRVLAVLLVVIAAVLVGTHVGSVDSLGVADPVRTILGVIAGFAIGVVAAVMGVAGGELLIPTIVLLYGLDIKSAGSLSLAVSLPTMLVAFTRYSRDQSFVVLRDNRRLVAAMGAGSVVGTTIGGILLNAVSARILVPLLAALLLISAKRVWAHAQ